MSEETRKRIRLAVKMTFQEFGPVSKVATGLFLSLMCYLWIFRADGAALWELKNFLLATKYGIAACLLLLIYNYWHSAPLYLLSEELRTAHETIALAPKAPSRRQLTDVQKIRLGNAIKEWCAKDGQVRVLYTPTSTEAEDFATSIGDACRDAGLLVNVYQPALFDHDPKARGVYVWHVPGDEQRAIKLQKAMQNDGIDAFLLQNDDKYAERSVSALYVARAPS